MHEGADDDLAVGQALVQELAEIEDPVARREALDGVRDCEKRLGVQERYADALRLLDGLLAWQLGCESEDASDTLDKETAYTMLSRTERLRDLDRYVEAVAQADDLVQQYAKDMETASSTLQRYAANVLYWKGASLVELERWLEALVVFDELIARENAVPDAARRWVAYARDGRGDALRGLGDRNGAVEAYSEGIAALTDDDDPRIVRVVEEMLSAKGRVLARLGRTDEAITIYDALIARPEPLAPYVAASAYLGKASSLLRRHNFEAAIETVDAATHRFGSSDDPDIRSALALCFELKIGVLYALGRKDAAAFTAEQLVDSFGADLNPTIERIVARHAHRLARSRSRLRFLGLR